MVKKVEVFAEAEVDGTNLISVNLDSSTGDNNDESTPCKDQKAFFVKEYYYNGDCFALRLPECVRSAGVLEIVMDFYNKTDIFIHHAGQFLSPNSRYDVPVLLLIVSGFDVRTACLTTDWTRA